MDPIEKHIVENKDLFERPFNNENKLWSRIESELETGSKTKWTKPYLKMIIAFLVLLVIVLVGFLYVQNSKLAAHSYADNRDQELEDISNHYGKQVAFEIGRLENTKTLSVLEKKEFLAYIDELNQEQNDLKDALNDNINNEEILDAIVQNFNQQIKLINQLVDRLQNQEKNTYESGISM